MKIKYLISGIAFALVGLLTFSPTVLNFGGGLLR